MNRKYLVFFLLFLLISLYYLYLSNNANINMTGGASSNEPRPSVLATCPQNYTNNGSNCVRQARSYPLISVLANCPSGYTNNGTVCTSPTASSFSPSVIATCPTNYTNNGISCTNDADSYVKSCSVQGGQTFPCKSGFTDMGCYCQSTTPSPVGNMTCSTNYVLNGGRCYQTCKTGYTRQGEYCVQPVSNLPQANMTCSSNYYRKGAYCYKSCDTDYVVNNGLCQSPPDTLSQESQMTCPTNYPELIGTSCYGACVAPLINSGNSCVTSI